MTTCLKKNCSFGFHSRVFRQRLSVCLCASFRFGFDGGMWDLIVFLIIAYLFTLDLFFLMKAPTYSYYISSISA